MRVPMSWLRELVDLPAAETGRSVAERLLRAGLEVETVEVIGEVTGPLVTGRVLAYEEEKHSNGKTVRWCQVDVGEGGPRGIVCGALNFAVGDVVVLALPGAVLPGGFAIGARKTYGRVSDGMICSARELGLGADHTGILVLPTDTPVGVEAAPLLGLGEEVLDIAVKPDRAYCLSMRGIARETATAYGLPFRDPVSYFSYLVLLPDAWPVVLEDPAGCDRFVALGVSGFDPVAPSPSWLQQRLRAAGMRSISLAVDVTNFVMLELGQPLHAYDRDRLAGSIVVRRAGPGERLRTLDGVERSLDREDLLITDDSGPIGIAGVMGGASTEISASTTDIVLESAHFDPVTVARSARRHRLPSEASRRFERGVDSQLQYAAAARAGQLLAELGGGALEGAKTEVGQSPETPTVELPIDLPGRVVGRPYSTEEVRWALTEVGCELKEAPNSTGGRLRVTPPPWRPDLVDPYDLVEEVARLHGYGSVPAVLPVAPAGRGLTADQRRRRRIGIALAEQGFIEVPTYPFLAPGVFEDMGLPAEDPRRQALRLLNPLSDAQPLLRTTLLPGLLEALRRNVGRGQADVALYEIGLVFRPRPHTAPAPRLPVDHRPSTEQLAALDAALPNQPRRVAAVLAGALEPAGWWGSGRAATWADAVEAARTVARAAGVELSVGPDDHAPWHPGRCAALYVDGGLVGHAGELHPRVVAALGLPPRTCAMELELDRLTIPDTPTPAPRISTFPVATQDVALVVPEEVPAAAVEAALRSGAGALLESLRLFDVYTGTQVGEGRRSLAYALRFRAPDRTLTVEEASSARDAAVAEARKRTGAVLRGA